MKVFRILKRDLRLGLAKQWYRYLFIVIVGAAGVYEMYDLLGQYAAGGAVCEKAGFWEYLFFNVSGIKPYTLSMTGDFYIPMLWFCIQIGFHYVIAYYPEQDLREYGKQVLISSKSRAGWWFGKCIWCFAAAAVYFILLGISTAVSALILEGDLSFVYNGSANRMIMTTNFQYAFFQDLVLSAVVVPFFVTFALGLLQMLLSLIITPVISFALICSVYVVSAYYTSVWLPGSFTMLRRSSFLFDEGLSPYSGLIVAGAVIIISVFAGQVYMSNKDVL